MPLTLPFAPIMPVSHDGFISGLRAYSPSALRALARYADPAITVELRGGGVMTPQIVVASRLRSRGKHGASAVFPARPPAVPSTADRDRSTHRSERAPQRSERA